MSYHQKNVAVSLCSGLIVLTLYSIIVIRLYYDGRFDGPGAHWLVGWSPFAMFTGGIALTIVLHILSTIYRTVRKQEEEPFITDERDKMIELKGLRFSFFAFCIFFLAVMGALALNLMGPYTVLLFVVGGLYVAGISGEIVKLVLYRRDA